MSASLQKEKDYQAIGPVLENNQLNAKKSKVRNDSYYKILNSNLAELIPQYAEKILDIGCGMGVLGSALKKKHPHMKIWGVEEVHSIAELAKHHLDTVIEGDIETNLFLPFDKQFFDVLVFDETLGLLNDPEATIKKLLPYLKTGGKVIASSSNIAHWSVIMNLVKGDIEVKEQSVFDPDRIRFFTSKTMRALFEKLDLEIDHFERIVKPSKRANKYLSQLATIYEYSLDGLEEEWSTYQFMLSASLPSHVVDKLHSNHSYTKAVVEHTKTNTQPEVNSVHKEELSTQNRPPMVSKVRTLDQEAHNQKEITESLKMLVADQLLKNQSLEEQVESKEKLDISSHAPAPNSVESTAKKHMLGITIFHCDKDADFPLFLEQLSRNTDTNTPIHIINLTDQTEVFESQKENLNLWSNLQILEKNISLNTLLSGFAHSVLMRTECIVSSGWLSRLEHHLYQKQFQIIGPVIDMGEGLQRVEYHVPKDISGDYTFHTMNDLLYEHNQHQSAPMKIIEKYCIAIDTENIGTLDIDLLNHESKLKQLVDTYKDKEKGIAVARDVFIHIEKNLSITELLNSL